MRGPLSRAVRVQLVRSDQRPVLRAVTSATSPLASGQSVNRLLVLPPSSGQRYTFRVRSWLGEARGTTASGPHSAASVAPRLERGRWVRSSPFVTSCAKPRRMPTPATLPEEGPLVGDRDVDLRVDEEYMVVNFYRFTDVEKPEEWAQAHKTKIASEELDIRGRIYVSDQGINAQLSGVKDSVLEYVRWIATHRGFEDLELKSWTCNGHAFPRLSLKYKPNLVQLEGGMQGVDVSEMSKRAVKVSAQRWHEMLEEAKKEREELEKAEGGQGPTKKPKTVVVDVRNAYEYDVGHFEGALRPSTDQFREQELAGVPGDLDKDKTRIMMYCTGGIRCDVLSAKLVEEGYKRENLFTLDGGVAKYFREKGGDMWNGHLFVFDSRLAVPPVEGNPEASLEALEAAHKAIEEKDNRHEERFGPPPERGDGHRRRRSAWHERVRQRQEAAFLQLGHIGDEAFQKAKAKAEAVRPLTLWGGHNASVAYHGLFAGWRELGCKVH